MHISEGVLSGQVLAAGAALAAVGVAAGLKTTKEDDIPKVALLSAAFFAASFVHFPIGPANAHFVLNGLTGLILGWAAFPAILTAAFLQGVIFHFGGLTTLGVNTFIMAAPATLCGLVFRRGVLRGGAVVAAVSAFLCGFLSIVLSGLLTSAALVFTEEGFLKTARLVLAAHAPVAVIEGAATVFITGFLLRVRPEILGGEYENETN